MISVAASPLRAPRTFADHCPCPLPPCREHAQLQAQCDALGAALKAKRVVDDAALDALLKEAEAEVQAMEEQSAALARAAEAEEAAAMSGAGVEGSGADSD